KRGKDTPKFEPGTPQGPVNYPPYETCAEFYEEHCIYPQGKLMDYAHTYLYRSDKREFNDKTGRDDFRVFAYQFLWRGVARYVLWDYISGRIRVTHLFKCNNLAKTAPKKFLDANPGLKDLSYNITGGTLATQGYWMPFECVKA
ncbi:putative APSES transcription factor Xbp1, partial [Aspergillus homomorphus CBS 101889]